MRSGVDPVRRERRPRIGGALEVAAVACRPACADAEVGERTGPARAAVERGGCDEPVRAAVRPAVLLERSDDVVRVSRVDGDPGLDFGVLVEDSRLRNAFITGRERAGPGRDEGGVDVNTVEPAAPAATAAHTTTSAATILLIAPPSCSSAELDALAPTSLAPTGAAVATTSSPISKSRVRATRSPKCGGSEVRAARRIAGREGFHLGPAVRRSRALDEALVALSTGFEAPSALSGYAMRIVTASEARRRVSGCKHSGSTGLGTTAVVKEADQLRRCRTLTSYRATRHRVLALRRLGGGFPRRAGDAPARRSRPRSPVTRR